jgi:general secretion pathway protein G
MKDRSANHHTESGLSSAKGFSLVEMIMVILIMGTLAAIGIPYYLQVINSSRTVRAVGDIKKISGAIDLYLLANSTYPKTIEAALGYTLMDPWGHPYQYLSFEGLKGKGIMRKDKNLVPINSDYDLYSMGQDGRSTSPLTAQISHDDIIRANNGGYIGLAENY